MANCSSCNGCSGRGCTRVGALGTLCRSGCRNPYYTGPCPAAPCTDSCGSCSSNNGCNCCRCRRNAAVTDCEYGCSDCGCRGCCHCSCDRHGCGNSCGNSSCGCSGNCCDCSDDDDDCDRRRTAYGVFTLGGAVHISAGGTAEFAPCDVNPDYFTCRGGSIVIRRPGLYRAVLTVEIPKFTEADTVLRLELNGKPIPAAEIHVDAADCAAAVSYTTDAVFEACAGAKLKMRASNALNIGREGGGTLIKMTIHRI